MILNIVLCLNTIIYENWFYSISSKYVAVNNVGHYRIGFIILPTILDKQTIHFFSNIYVENSYVNVTFCSTFNYRISQTENFIVATVDISKVEKIILFYNIVIALVLNFSTRITKIPYDCFKNTAWKCI